jgi:alcohol dehydrogenase (cytochrome c)
MTSFHSSQLAALAANLLLAGTCDASVAMTHVPFERIQRSAREPGNWLTYSGNYAGHRHSTLAEITPANVAGLKPKWIYQAPEAGTKWEVTPLIVDGLIFISERPNIVTALDATSGRPVWNYRRELPAEARNCCGVVNRGLAILDDALFLGTLDARLVCIDANTGRERWDVEVADYRSAHAITVAPLAVKDKVIVGVSGGEYGIRGFLDAYDARTGKRVWRFWTVPGPGEPGHETWGTGDAWKTGGAPTWITGTFDPALNLVYWGTGNPSPDLDGDNRPGDNLYSDCVIALDADTGALRWHFQYTPHDIHDWDSNQVPMLIDASIEGRMRRLLVHANRNAFFYVLDRETGEFIRGEQFGMQTWAAGLDRRGRPILVPGKEPTEDGVLVYPGTDGAVNWPSPSYNPLTGLVYVQSITDYGQVYYKRKMEYQQGRNFFGGSARGVFGEEPRGVIKALEATTGKLRWEFKEHAPSLAGILTTAGGVLFSGTHEGQVFALDATDGRLLWRFTTGGVVCGGPVSFLLGGRQHLAVAAGTGLFVFGL